ncbi:hypothetical protein QBC38DRAFT_511985 [Podospora fimiseda]|uniref:Uncharacterized protein n=1 Tax=Podospora fimiseda TaxID=252190 RepID=A0AAN7BIM6_9PEZI|nr:hypothetical protein QBC38DRAFT_511985 [Podospora fimiseda]
MERRSANSAARPIEYLLRSILDTSSIITRFIRLVRAAHADLSAVTRDLSDLRLVLELVKEEPRIPLMIQAQILLLLESCGNVLIQIESILSQCKDAAQWLKTGQSQMAQCRVNLGTFREGLELALDVLTVTSTSQKGRLSPDEVQSLKEHIVEEIIRLRKHGSEPGMNQDEAGQVLLMFIDAVDGCVRQWTKKSGAVTNGHGQPKEGIMGNGSLTVDSTNGHYVEQGTQHPDVEEKKEITLVARDEKEAAVVVVAEEQKMAPVVDDQEKEVLRSGAATPVPGKTNPTPQDTVPESPENDNRYSAVSDTLPWISSRPNENAFSYHVGEEDLLSVIRPEDHEPLPIPPQIPPREDMPKEVVIRNLPESPTLPPQDFYHKTPPLPTPPLITSNSHSSDSTVHSHRGTPPPLTPDWGGNTSNEESSPITTHSEPLSPTNFLDIEPPRSLQDRWSDPTTKSARGSTSSGDSLGTKKAGSVDSYPHKKHAVSRGTSIIDDEMLPLVLDAESRRSTMSFPRNADSIMELSVGASTPRAASPAPSTATGITVALSGAPDYRRSPTPSATQWVQSLRTPSALVTPSFLGSIRSPSILSSRMVSPSIISPKKVREATIPVPAKHTPNSARATISPSRHLTEPKAKSGDILHIDVSCSSQFVATRHSKTVKIWSVPKNTVQSTIKITSYVTPQVRSREYFIRSHAILSESATLIAIASHFGITLDIYNFSKGGTSSKKVQVIEEAHRWATSPRDAYHTDYSPLVVYRPKGDRIDRFFLARNPAVRKLFWEDNTHSIELSRAELPFIPKFPELAFSSDSPFLVAAAGPRPGDPPRAHATILIAWHMKPTSDTKLLAKSPNATVTSLDDPERHKPYRFNVPEYPALQTALPAALAARGSIAVSIWIPANHADIPLAGGKFRRNPIPASERYVVVWDLPNNSTRIFAIPNVQACISPDCKLIAYCDSNAGCFVIVDVDTAEEVWKFPDAAKESGFASFGQLENLNKVTVFEFSADGGSLVVGDSFGGVGVYEVKVGGPRYELGDGTELALADVPGYVLTEDQGSEGRISDSSLVVPLGYLSECVVVFYAPEKAV